MRGKSLRRRFRHNRFLTVAAPKQRPLTVAGRKRRTLIGFEIPDDRRAIVIAERPMDPDSPLICFAGGGTGGHLYPALAVAGAIREREPTARFLFFGTTRRVEDHVLHGKGSYDSVRQELAPWSLRPWRWPRIYGSLRAARASCRERFEADRPSFVIGTGGMASVPAVLAAIQMGIPTAILNPDALPGRANRYLASRVDAVFAQWELTKSRLSRANVVVTGCPVRGAFLAADRTTGITRFGLDSARRTLLVTGASQGARTINDAILANSDFLSRIDGWQILHLTGESDYQRVQSSYHDRKAPAAVISYTDHMAEAVAAADLVVSRAGASTLAELTALGRASILMPYPYHRDQHQMANARCLEEHGAALVVKDTADVGKNAAALAATLKALLNNDAARGDMAQAAAGLGRPNAADSIAGLALQALRSGVCVAGFQR